MKDIIPCESSNKSLTESFNESISDEVKDMLINYGEIGLDAFLNDGLLKDIPFLSTVVSVYKIGHSLHARYHLKKLYVFLKEINASIEDKNKRQDYINKFDSKRSFRDKELEYIIILIERYIGMEKPKMIAKLYLAFLYKDINWDSFTMYAEVIDRFLPGDFIVLSNGGITLTNHDGHEAILRLEALGLMAEKRSDYHVISGGTLGEDIPDETDEERTYIRTAFGEKLVSILNGD